MDTGFILNMSAHDQERIRNDESEFKKWTDKQLAEKYFGQARLGITGDRRQMLYLIALRNTMKDRFGKSPIKFDGKAIEL